MNGENSVARLLIVDDEEKTRQGLADYVDWAGLGIDEVKTAGNSEDAIKLCVRFVPDIILSDIRMPGMNGIELCTYIKGQIPDCEIIFLSGYADKEYLKAAIELNAVSYVEKPVDIDEIEDAVGKAMQRIRQSRERKAPAPKRRMETAIERQAEILFLVAGPHAETSREREQTALRLFPGTDLYFRVVLIQCSQAAENRLQYEARLQEMLARAFAGIKYELAFKDTRHVVLICWSKSRAALADDCADFRLFGEEIAAWNWENQRLFAAVGDFVTEQAAIYQSYYTASVTLLKVFFDGYGKVKFYQEGQTMRVEFDENLYDLFSACVDRRDSEGAIQILNEVYRRFRGQNNVIPSSIKNIYFRFGYRLEASQRAENKKEKREANESRLQEQYHHYIWEKFISLDTLQEIRDYLEKKTLDALRVPEYNPVVCKVISFIRTHYSDEALSVRWLASKVYVSPTYLSRLFKEQTGKSVGQMILDVRMEHARELLLDTNLKLQHIAVAVGYSDASYFAKTFKKAVGIMPSEYRKRNV